MDQNNVQNNDCEQNNVLNLEQDSDSVPNKRRNLSRAAIQKLSHSEYEEYMRTLLSDWDDESDVSNLF